MKIQLGIQSYCFRELNDRREIARNVRALGLDRMEVCELHGDFSDPVAWRDTVAFYRDEGIVVDSIGVQNFTGDPAQERWFESAAEAGIGHLSAHFKVDSFARAIAQCRDWSRAYGVRIGLHPHGGYMFGGQPDVIRHLLQLGGDALGITLDTAWVLQIGPRGGGPVGWVEEFGDRISALHLKDFTFEPSGQWSEHITGEGNLPLDALARALNEAGFDGTGYIEYEADEANPMPALKRCVEAVRDGLSRAS